MVFHSLLRISWQITKKLDPIGNAYSFRRNSMSFEDVEYLKNAFTIYNIPKRPSRAEASGKPFMIIRKRNTIYTRVVLNPQNFGVKHNFKMLTKSLLYKLKIKRA
jgi:hypothetical protein